MTRVWLVLPAIAVAACTSPNATTPAASAAPVTSIAVHISHQPPTPKDVIDAVIASGSVPLKTSPTCANVGTEPTDATIGRYLSGFLAELSDPGKKNWIETRIEPGRGTTGEAVSVCTLTLRHEDGDDRWGWGVRFQVRSRDGLVLNNSFTCVGAG